MKMSSNRPKIVTRGRVKQRHPAFAKNQLEELGFNETDPCEDEEANYTPPAYDYSLDSE